LKRRGFSPERIAQVKQMHRALYRKRLTLADSRAEIAALRGQLAGSEADIALMLDFLGSADRGIVR
jgi:UDP-N-acetylglucosamine acyltransferase